jgi:hypothetical protein
MRCSPQLAKSLIVLASGPSVSCLLLAVNGKVSGARLSDDRLLGSRLGPAKQAPSQDKCSEPLGVFTKVRTRR